MCDHVLRKYKLFAHYAIKTTDKHTTEASLDFSFARIWFIRNAKINRCHSLNKGVMTTTFNLASSYLEEEALLHKHFNFILYVVDLDCVHTMPAQFENGRKIDSKNSFLDFNAEEKYLHTKNRSVSIQKR